MCGCVLGIGRQLVWLGLELQLKENKNFIFIVTKQMNMEINPNHRFLSVSSLYILQYSFDEIPTNNNFNWGGG